MGAEDGLKIGVNVLVAVSICAAILVIFRLGSNMINKGTSQAANMISEFDDIDKQKYDGMSILGGEIVNIVSNYWEDSSCEVVICTMDGVNVAYNVTSDGTYTVPFSDELSGMPTADCKGRVFNNKSVDNGSALPKNASVDSVQCVSAADLAGFSNPAKEAAIANAATVASSDKILATEKGYNTLMPVGAGGYISQTAVFVGSVQKDINGNIRRITFVQK